jgi:hypothetical protein
MFPNSVSPKAVPAPVLKPHVFYMSTTQIKTAPAGHWAHDVRVGLDSGQFSAQELRGWYWDVLAKPDFFGNGCPAGPFSTQAAAIANAKSQGVV